MNVRTRVRVLVDQSHNVLIGNREEVEAGDSTEILLIYARSLSEINDALR